MMFKFITVIIFYLLLPSVGYSQESIPNNLYQGLQDLKKNVEQMNLANQSIALKNDKLRVDLKKLEIEYQAANQEKLKFQEQFTKLQKSDQSVASKLELLNKSLKDLEDQENKIKKQQDDLEMKIAELKREDQGMGLDDKGKMGSQTESSSMKIAQILEKKQKQRLAMLKLIADSQTKQALLHEKFLDYQKSLPTAVDSLNDDSKKRQLESQIVQLQSEIIQLNSMVNKSNFPWKEDQINQLEASVQHLEENREELKNLIKMMQKKMSYSRGFEEKSKERLKIESNIESLKGETRGLRIDLEELQQQMVGLDKRKSYLEALYQN